MRASVWAKSITKKLHGNLDSIRNKILLFAVLATLVPSGITAWISYSQNRRALEERLNQELVSTSSQAAREMVVWLKERFQEMRTMGNSYEVTENLAKGATATRRLNDYLSSVRGRMGEYGEFIVLDVAGQPVASTSRETTPVRLPPDWAKTLRTEGKLVGGAYWDESAREPTLILAVPAERLDGRLLGVFAAKVKLATVREELRKLVASTDINLYLATTDGTFIVSPQGSSAELMAMRLKPATVDRLTQREGSTVSYTNATGGEVVGSLKRVTGAQWAVVSEIPADIAYREIRRFRNLALAVVFGLMAVVSLIAYRLGLIIVRPLDSLTRGAVEVGAGDLAVDLPAVGGGEVGLLTDVFNYMVSQLRESRRELDSTNDKLRKQNETLERLSTIDGLTGLFNRRYLSERLNEEVLRTRRHKRAFGVLMIDVDHFKTYNDAYGHPAGDEVLKKVAEILRYSTREVDCVARYGGEEFCVILPETPADAATQIAERIRERVATEEFPERKVTVSIGIAEFPTDGDKPDIVVESADAALYEAKHQGRDRVARVEARRVAEHKPVENDAARRRGSKKGPTTGGRRGS